MRKFITKIWFLLFLFTSLGYCLGLLATKVSPEQFWPIIYFGLAFPVFLLILLFFLAYWAFTRNKKFFFPLLLLIVGWGTVSAFFSVAPFSTSKPAANSLKLMTYNVRNFELYHWKENKEKRDEMFELIRQENPDIVCFQEFYNGEKHTTVESVSKALNLPHAYYEVGLTTKRNSSFGIAIFSKYPLKNKHKINLGTQGNLAQAADVIRENDTLTIFNLHLASVRFDKEDYEFLEELKEDGTKANNSKSKAIARKLKNSYIERGKQAKSVRAEVDATPYPTLICGDFNDTPVSYAYQLLAENFQDVHKTTNWGIGHTYSDILPLFRIDHILAGPQFEVNRSKIIRKQISDHYPVVSEVSLR